jgi:hypothetical protein
VILEIGAVRFVHVSRSWLSHLEVLKMQTVVPAAIPSDALQVDNERRGHAYKRENISKTNPLNDSNPRHPPLLQRRAEAGEI